MHNSLRSLEIKQQISCAISVYDGAAHKNLDPDRIEQEQKDTNLIVWKQTHYCSVQGLMTSKINKETQNHATQPKE
jgi:hypothetical protein